MNSSPSPFVTPFYYALVGNGTSPLPSLDAWPIPGTFGAIPNGGAVVTQSELLDRISPELWPAQRDGHKVCLQGPPHRVEEVALLTWAADCVDHALSQVGDTDNGNVAACVQFARNRAQTRSYDKDTAIRLASETELLHRQLSRSTKKKGGKAVLAALFGFLGPRFLRPSVERYDSRRMANADADSAMANLLASAVALCQDDVFAAAAEVSDSSRKAAARKALAAVAHTNANEAEESSWLNLNMNPLARERLVRSAPGQLGALKDAGEAERTWQLERLTDCLGLTPASG